MIDKNDDAHDSCDTGCTEYNALSRRQFVGAAAAASATAFFPAWLPKVVLAESAVSTRDIIVSIFMRGGADGLSLCVPFGDANYYASRSTIAIRSCCAMSRRSDASALRASARRTRGSSRCERVPPRSRRA